MRGRRETRSRRAHRRGRIRDFAVNVNCLLAAATSTVTAGQYGGTDDQRQAAGREAQHRRSGPRKVRLQGHHGGDDRTQEEASRL